LRICVILIASCLPLAVSGCSQAPKPPSAEEVAKGPPLPPPKGKENARTVSD